MKRTLLVLLAGAVTLFPALAQSTSDSAPSADMTTSQAEADFFGSSKPTVEKAKPTTTDPTLAFTAQGTSWGGTLYDKIEWNGGWLDANPNFSSLADNWGDSVNYTLNNIFYMNSRPDKNFRVKVALVSNWPFTQTVYQPFYTPYQIITIPASGSTGNPATYYTYPLTIPTVRIWELFADVTVDHFLPASWDTNLYIRFGKQEASWGVAYFYSAGDVLSLTGIDPNNPTAEREGPVALKVSLPFPDQRVDLSGFVVAPDSVFTPTPGVPATTPTFRDLGYALRADASLANMQWALSGYYQRDQAKKLVGSVSGGLGWLNLPFAKDINWFTEEIAAYGADRWLGTGSQMLGSSGLTTFTGLSKPWQPYFSNVSGLSYSNSEYNASIRVEYYYNGEGSADQTYPQKLYNAYLLQLSGNPLFGTNSLLTTNDIVYPGIHNLTALLSLTTLDNSKFDASALLQQNFSDGSGWVKPLLTYNFNNFFSLYTGLQFVWGAKGTQFPLQFQSYANGNPQTQRVTLVLGGQIGSQRY